MALEAKKELCFGSWVLESKMLHVSRMCKLEARKASSGGPLWLSMWHQCPTITEVVDLASCLFIEDREVLSSRMSKGGTMIVGIADSSW
jgi:hypothetical protein